MLGFICGEEHEDVADTANGQWRQPPGCPRYHNPDPRPGRPLPMWDDHECEIPDIARFLFVPRYVELADHDELYPAGIPTAYPTDPGQEISALRFSPLLPGHSPYRALARRVTAIHDRLIRVNSGSNPNDDLRSLWRNRDRREGDIVRFVEGRHFVELLSALRMAITNLHNILVHPDEEGLDPDDMTIQRVLLVHACHQARQRFQCYYDNFLATLAEDSPLRLDTNAEWRRMWQLLRPLQLDADEATEQALAQARYLLAGMLPDIEAGEDLFLQSMSRRTTDTIELVQQVRDEYAGRLTMSDIPLVRRLLDRIDDSITHIGEDLGGPEAFCERSDQHLLLYELAASVSGMFQETVGVVAQRGEAGHWAERYEYIRDLLAEVGRERLLAATRERAELPRLAELYHVLGELEPIFRHVATLPHRYMDVGQEAWDAAIRVRNESRYKAGDGHMAAMLGKIYEYQRYLLTIYGRASPYDRNHPLRGAPPEHARRAYHEQWTEVADQLIEKYERMITIRFMDSQVDRHTVAGIDLLTAMCRMLQRLAEPGR